jgi:hypothetical protein
MFASRRVLLPERCGCSFDGSQNRERFHIAKHFFAADTQRHDQFAIGARSSRLEAREFQRTSVRRPLDIVNGSFRRHLLPPTITVRVKVIGSHIACR